MKVLITLGPTQEPIDSVRYITNASSGKMGAELARESIFRGNKTTIISGPVEIPLPSDAKIIKVRTAEEMIDSTMKELRKDYQILISTAAIADYTPERIDGGKIKSNKGELILKLKPTPKLTGLAKEKFPELFIVAFKAEYGISKKELMERAKGKLEKENLNLIIANDVKKNGFGSDKTEVFVIDDKNSKIHITKNSKKIITKRIWDVIEEKLH